MLYCKSLISVFKTLEVSVKGQTTFNITLQEDTENLQEVVVVGYGSSVKKDLTTAVTSVSSKDFLAGAVNDPMQMVDGKSPESWLTVLPLLTRIRVVAFKCVERLL